MDKTVKTTPLHPWHKSQGATLADFGGYEMPLWYSSVKNEHLAVLTAAGIFDTSHMASVIVKGSGAFDLLQVCFSNNLAHCIGPLKKPLFPGRCVYGAFLDPKGQTIDDAIVFHLEENHYMVVVNAGMGGDIAAHLENNKKGLDADITDLTDRLGKMDIQGPAAGKIMKTLLKDPDTVFDAMPYFSFKGFFDPASPLSGAVKLKDGTPVLLSRTGYTGEFGFEIFMAKDKLVDLWTLIYEAGRPFDLLPCGLAARDSLRAGAVLPLSHQDIGHWPFINHPWPFALAFDDTMEGFTKSFMGSEALLNLTAPEYTHAFAGNDLRKVSDPATVVDENGDTIGTVLTCATDMGIGRVDGNIISITSPDRPEGFKPKGLCCGFVKTTQKLETGQTVTLKDSRRKLTVTIVDDVRPDRTARKPFKRML